jgi:chorismate synthase
VAAGALARSLLNHFGIEVGSFVVAIGDQRIAPTVLVSDLDEAGLWALAGRAEDDPVRCPDPGSSARMVAAIDAAKESGETLGGVFVVFATGVPPGLGSHVHWDRKLDGLLLGALGSIHAVKGAEVGDAFALAERPGTEAVDSIVRGGADGEGLARPTNRSGGLEGGMTNGRPVVLRAAMKPLSSVRREVESIDLRTGAPVDPAYVRSDVCAVPAAAVVGEAMVAWVLADALTERFGADRLDAMLAAFDAVRADARWTAPSDRPNAPLGAIDADAER